MSLLCFIRRSSCCCYIFDWSHLYGFGFRHLKVPVRPALASSHFSRVLTQDSSLMRTKKRANKRNKMKLSLYDSTLLSFITTMKEHMMMSLKLGGVPGANREEAWHLLRASPNDKGATNRAPVGHLIVFRGDWLKGSCKTQNRFRHVRYETTQQSHVD